MGHEVTMSNYEYGLSVDGSRLSHDGDAAHQYIAMGAQHNNEKKLNLTKFLGGCGKE